VAQGTVRRFVTDECGADFIEYAFIVGLVVVATASLLSPLMPNVLKVFDALAAAASKVTP
jgi:Flp pilus assembly pilin Flp